MARNVFYSFHYTPDSWRASQVRNMGVLTGNSPCKDHDWEDVKKGGDIAIRNWIRGQMAGRTCAVILVGTHTAGRKWINFEIEEAWNQGKGVVAIRIHKLRDSNAQQSTIGGNPFSGFTVNRQSMSSIAKIYDSPYSSSQYVYDHIQNNISDWVEEAIRIRRQH